MFLIMQSRKFFAIIECFECMHYAAQCIGKPTGVHTLFFLYQKFYAACNAAAGKKQFIGIDLNTPSKSQGKFRQALHIFVIRFHIKKPLPVFIAYSGNIMRSVTHIYLIAVGKKPEVPGPFANILIYDPVYKLIMPAISGFQF